jgi:hypothetical protein
MTISDRIKTSRSIADSSLKLYLSNIKRLNGLITGEAVMPENLNSWTLPLIKKALSTIDKITTRKNIITAAIVGLGSETDPDQPLIDSLQALLKEHGDKYTAFLVTQKKTPQQDANWMSYADIIGVAKALLKRIKNERLLTASVMLDNEAFKLVQGYVLLLTYLHQPIRNDYADMRVVTVKELAAVTVKEQKLHNYLLVKPSGQYTYILNIFKNSATIGAKRLPVAAKVASLYDRWLQLNRSGWLFVKPSKRTLPMAPAGITVALQKLFFPKRIGSSMLRHIIASHMAEGTPSIAEENAEEKSRSDGVEDTFLHSSSMNKLYRKL